MGIPVEGSVEVGDICKGFIQEIQVRVQIYRHAVGPGIHPAFPRQPLKILYGIDF